MRSSIAKIRVLVAVAEAQSISAASAVLDLNPSTVSRQLSELENDLGLLLFRRDSRRLQITKPGERVLAHYSVILDELQKVEGMRESALTELHVTAPKLFGKYILTPCMKSFMAQHQGIVVNIDYADDVRDHIHEQFDVGIAGHQVQSQNMIARPIAPLSLAIVGAPETLAAFGSIESSADLKRALWVVLREHPAKGARELCLNDGYLLDVRDLGTNRISVNDQETLLNCVLGGMGIALVERIAVTQHLQSGELVEVLPGIVPDLGQYWVYRPKRRIDDECARLFYRYVQEFCRRQITGEVTCP